MRTIRYTLAIAFDGTIGITREIKMDGKIVAFAFMPDTVFQNDACGIIEGSIACTRLNNKAKIQAMQPQMVPMPQAVQDEIEHTQRLASDGYEHTIELTKRVA